MAGDPSIQSYFYKKFGYGESYVLSKNEKNHIIDYYNIVEKLPRVRNVIREALKRCNDDIDIISIHGYEFAVPIFKILTRKKIILQYHGSDINLPNRSKNPFLIICRSMADAITYNQEIHLKKIITIKKVIKEYHPTPVDTDLFCPQDVIKEGKLSIIYDHLNRKEILESLSQFDDLKIHDRSNQPIPYEKMPDFFNKYKTYVDYRITQYGLKLTALSRSALEALACGCNVILWDEHYDKLPESHEPKVVIKKLYSLCHVVLTGKEPDE